MAGKAKRRFWIPSPLGLLTPLAVVCTRLGYALVGPSQESEPQVPPRLNPQEVRFPSLDGTRLRGLYIPGRKAYPTIVLCHGYARSLAEPWGVALRLNEGGYNVFLFDFRACGKSGGLYSTVGYQETWDLLAAVQYVKATFGRGPIGVLGISMGAAAAVMAAAQSQDIAAVVADSAFATLEGVTSKKVRDVAPLRRGLPLGWLGLWAGQLLSAGRLGQVKPVEHVDKISPRPILFVYGERDSFIPPEGRQQLIERAGEPKEVWLAPGSDHAMARLDYPQEYLRRVLAFFARYLSKAKAARGRAPR